MNTNTPDPVTTILHQYKKYVEGVTGTGPVLSGSEAKVALDSYYAKLYAGKTVAIVKNELRHIVEGDEDGVVYSIEATGHRAIKRYEALTKGTDLTTTDSSQENGHSESPPTPPKSTDNDLDNILADLVWEFQLIRNGIELGQHTLEEAGKLEREELKATSVALQNKIAEAVREARLDEARIWNGAHSLSQSIEGEERNLAEFVINNRIAELENIPVFEVDDVPGNAAHHVISRIKELKAQLQGGDT